MKANDLNAISNNDMKTEEGFETSESNITEKQLDESIAQLNAWEKALSEREDKNVAEEKRLEEKSQALDRREKYLTARETEIVDEGERLKKIEAVLDRRGKDITERELEAAEGFKKLRERELDETVTVLQSEINMLQKQKLELISEQETQRRSLIDDANKRADSIISEATSARKNAEVTLERNLQKQEELAKREAEIAVKESELRAQSEILSTERSRLKETALNMTYQMSEETISQLELAKKSKEDLCSENEKLRKQVNDFEHTQRAADGRTMAQLVEAENEYRDRINRLENKLIVFEREKADVEFLKSKVQEYSRLLDENKELSEENEKLRRQGAGTEVLESKVRILQNQSQNAVRERDAAKASAEALAAEMEVLKQTIESLKTIVERPAEREARINDIMSISFADKCAERTDASEIEWLNEIAEKIAASQIKISKRLLYAFHTSLKTAEWSPITVLAGVSGTGKSLLPKLYAMYGGFYFLPLAVQPDWDSSQSLFGFFNALDNKFNATKLLSALVQFQPDNPNSLSRYMMIVLLDEMNLAYVELYFSELLSKLEDRRGSVKAITIDVDLGSGLKKYEVELDRNIFWVGTMNEDETTKTLSDKVIDRSNMISFPRPKEFARRLSAELVKEDDKKLPKTVWKEWVDSTAVIDEDILNRYKVTVEKINEALGGVGRALGHRVWQAIENYICSHPCCIDAIKKADKIEIENSVQTAFEEAVVFKIMPKLRGIEITKQTKDVCFDPIKTILGKDAPGIFADFNRAVGGDQFVWRTSDYLEC